MKGNKARKKGLWIAGFLALAVLLSAVLISCFTAPSSARKTWKTGGDTPSISSGPESSAPPFAEDAAGDSSPEHPPEESLPPTPSEEPTPTPFPEYDITLMALGDNLMHMGIVKTGLQEDGSYDFSFLFQNMESYLSRADIRVINQETILGGDQLGFSGFPRFNSPTQVGDAIAAAGFNVVLHATNHAADQGIDGITYCAQFWKQYPDVLMTGISGQEGEEEIPLIQVGDITFAILNYTYGPNLETLDSSLRGHLNMLCDYDEKTGAIDFTTLHPQVLQEIRAAKQIADVVCVFPHWGTEYRTQPSSVQRDFARQMAEEGADLIIGTHPHVPQPVEWLETGDGRRTLCYYSLGNYVSTQKQTICMLEEMAWVTFHVTEEGIRIDDSRSGALPLVCHYTSGPVRLSGVYPLEEYTEEQARTHGIRNYGEGPLSLEKLRQDAQEILGDNMLSVSEIESFRERSDISVNR